MRYLRTASWQLIWSILLTAMVWPLGAIAHADQSRDHLLRRAFAVSDPAKAQFTPARSTDANTPAGSLSLTPTSTQASTANLLQPPGLLVFPYLGETTPTSVVISWATDRAGVSEIRYSLDQSYNNTVIATNNIYNGKVWHSATVVGLTTDTTYYYKAYTDGYDVTPWSEITFTTAAAPTTTQFTFVALGDGRPNGASLPPSQGALDLAAEMNRHDFDLVVHSGDIVYSGGTCTGEDSAWNQYIRDYFDLYREIIRDTPFYLSIGNHELIGGVCGYQSYKNVYQLPRNAPMGDREEYYSFDWGNAHFVALDTSQDFSTGSTQYNWLVDDLQTNSQPWTFVFFHYPAYSSGDHGSDSRVQTRLVPLFETYNVDVVFNGHDHDYERTCPILNDACTTPQDGGVVYYVTGGAGALLRSVSGDWFTAYAESLYHFIKIEVADCRLRLDAIDSRGTLFDSYEIDHCSTSTAPDIISNPITEGFVNEPYGYDVDATGNPPPTYTLSIAPPDMSINGITGKVSWTPAASGDFSVTVEAVNSTGMDAQVFTITVQDTYNLAVNTVGLGLVAVTPDQSTYHYGEVVTLTTDPDPGWRFAGWSGDLSGTNNPEMITMDGHKTVTATFTQEEYTLAVNLVGNGSADLAPSQSTYHYGDVVTLTADPAPGWSFAGWGGDLSGTNTPETIAMDGHKTVTATFTQEEYNLAVNLVGNGSVDLAPNQGIYYYGDVVTLTADPDPGWSFAGWSGDLSGVNNPETITMDGHKTVTATFTREEYTLALNVVGNGSVDLAPNQSTYHYGDVVTFTAIPDLGWSFASWSGDLSGSANPEELTMESSRLVTATFTNLSPVLGPIGDQVITSGLTLSFTTSASDPEGIIPSLGASNLPVGASFIDNGGGTALFSWKTGFKDIGDHSVTIIASDGVLTDTETITITVNRGIYQIFLPLVSGNVSPALATAPIQ